MNARLTRSQYEEWLRHENTREVIRFEKHVRPVGGVVTTYLGVPFIPLPHERGIEYLWYERCDYCGQTGLTRNLLGRQACRTCGAPLESQGQRVDKVWRP